ncbi:putative ubiquitin-protein ligase UFD4 NDAI_0K02110 [Naumovozyma dairenensis CBS 421]|uniref:HECT-type E3 ubiquitin transferase n=1 Tax=Naumovozyma dairenensis (strain ATCC 10597 / BCRC 20456 / CBS 421 / NBRC 0211 / NRRL Y-12639) TaxID=1071378 RepID=G0WHZ1_NAUDC|nr:hypothetical protein NDAI_0K02110 [Naumovozyma dairenensis CBS 421]CCD27402.1 hypothetical protein NDAI_0K02110 [Naumovozyma dairenensis CBS 421]
MDDHDMSEEDESFYSDAHSYREEHDILHEHDEGDNDEEEDYGMTSTDNGDGIDDDEDESDGENESHDGDDEHNDDHVSGRYANLQSALDRISQLRADAQGNPDTPNNSQFGMFPELLSMLREGGISNLNGGGADEEKSRLDKLIENVTNANDDPYFAMESLREISENLLMTNQFVLDRTLSVKKLLRSIIGVLDSPILQGELELQMQACRCLYNLFEINPDTVSMAVHQDIIPILQNKLLEINFIDLAEQVLETLEFISRVHGRDILLSGKLSHYIQYFDFFTIHAQRKAIAIVSNACCRVKLNDFPTVQDVFLSLNNIFVNTADEDIITKILNIVYAAAGQFTKDSMLDDLFTENILNHLIQMISGTDTTLQNKLKCIDILSQSALVSGKLARALIEVQDLCPMFENCFNEYKKTPNTPLHEILMFVPKSLLKSVARLLVSLFPAEKDQVLSECDHKKIIPLDNEEKLNLLLKNTTPLLVEIYINTVDFDVRRYVLIALARVVSCMNKSTAADVCKYLVRLIGSVLAQVEPSLRNDESNSIEINSSLIGVVSILQIVVTDFSDIYLSQVKREGVVELVNKIANHFRKINNCTDENSRTSVNDHDIESAGEIPPKENLDGRGHSESEEDGDGEEEEEEDDEYDHHGFGLGFSDGDIPDSVKPKKLKFNICKKLALNNLEAKTCQITEDLLSIFGTAQKVQLNELKDIEKLVTELHSLDIHFNCTKDEDWLQFWTTLQNHIFCGSFELSGFELVSTGLASALSEFLSRYEDWLSVSHRAFNKVFGENNFKKFVGILHAALNRVESFNILECGLQGEESGVASLSKQIRITLQYEGPVINGLDSSFTSPTVSIHSISSFATLNEFLRHRFARAQFLNTIIPNVANSEEATSSTNDFEGLKNLSFEFSYNNADIAMTDTIFGAIAKGLKKENKDIADMWKQAPSIIYRKNETASSVSRSEEEEEGREQERCLAIIYSDRTMVDSKSTELKSSHHVLTLLKFAKQDNSEHDIFINSKISAKLSRQLDEPLIVASGILPDWTLQLTREYSFLFPISTRLLFLRCTSFGYARLIEFWKHRNDGSKNINNDEQLQLLGRTVRHKLRISRNTIFLTGLKILSKYGSSPSILEIEYQDEIGTGLGPTLEFYATLSKEFAKKPLKMWRTDDYASKVEEQGDDTDYISELLFPAPIDLKADNAKLLELFEFLGTFIGRSMLDSRILDFRFNKLFFEFTHKRYRKMDLVDTCNDFESLCTKLSLVDAQLSRSLHYLYENKGDDDKISSLTLTFVLPGTDIELIENGANILVNSINVEDFIAKVLSYVLDTGIVQQLDAFIKGFSKVFPYVGLLSLMPDELVELFGRVEEDWSPKTLYSCISADHGYTIDSPTIHELIAIMADFDGQERRLFTQFLTGSPKLPIGGFRGLKPKFTVVLKHAEYDLTPDQYLPSVMTCANYLKLPKYSDQQIMRSRLKQAMEEGSGAFLLS